MSPAPRQGPVKSHLEQLIGRHSRDHGVAADRVRRWVSTMALLGALERAVPAHASPLFLLKGGVAIELRVRTGARATKDVDTNSGPSDHDRGEDERRRRPRPSANPACDTYRSARPRR